ncbi:hypothetical protein D3C81_1693370 [compost metagenome]
MGAAVVGAGEGDHAGAAGGGAGDLDGVLDGFGTGGDQQGLLLEVARHQLVELLGQGHVGLVAEHVEAGVGQLGQLLLHGGHHLRVQVAGVEHGDAAGEVQVLAAFHVPDGGVLGALGVDLVDLADAARDGGHAPLLQALVAVHAVSRSGMGGRTRVTRRCTGI